MEERKWCVYCHTNKINGKKYIGITGQKANRRWRKNGSGYQLHNQPKFRNAINKYGWNNFKHEILYYNLTLKEANQKEKFLINYYNSIKNGYNITVGGAGCGGYSHTDEWKIKMSKKMKLNPPYSKKVICEDIIYNSISECAIKYNINNSTMSNWLNSKIMPKEFIKLNLRYVEDENNRCRDVKQFRYGAENHNSKKVICSNITYNSISECANHYNIKEGTMQSWLKNKKMPKFFFENNLNYLEDKIKKKDIRILLDEKERLVNLCETRSNSCLVDNIKFKSVSQCAKYLNKTQSTINCYLLNKKPMPQKYIDRGLRYYNPETDKDLPIYVDTKNEV